MPWHPSLSVGIELIDEQHKEWFKRAEDLEAGKKGQAKEYIGSFWGFSISTPRSTLLMKSYMLSINYPG